MRKFVIKVNTPELEIDGNRLNLPYEVAETFAAYLKDSLQQPLHARTFR